MINVAVCDDETLHREDACRRIERLLKGNGTPFRLFPFASAEELLKRIDTEDCLPDLAVLDIEMDGEDGITLAVKLNEKTPACRIIFFTGYVDHAPEAYVAEHVWFVVKSRADEFFEPALRKALASFEEKETAILGLVVQEKGKRILVPIDEILYVGKVGRKAQVRCIDRSYSDTRRPALLIPETLEDHFLRCHQGYWVNFRMIEELDREEFVLRGGIRVPISRTFRQYARETFFERYHLE